MFTDSSKTIYGCVLFLFNLRTKSLHFLQAKNRFVNKQLSSKSIPTLEFQAISLGVEILMHVRDELSGSANVNPIKIVGMELYSDSLVCLHWLASHVNKFGKLRNLSIFVKNRLENIVKLCEEYPVSFHFCEGHENPADPITRSLSYKQLQKSNYLSGPDWYDSTNKQCGDLEVIIPNPLISSEDMPLEHDSCQLHIVADSDDLRQSHLFSLESCSKFTFVVGVYRRILQFVNVLKIRLRNKFPTRFSHFKVLDERELILEANRPAIRNDQKEHFPEIFSYYSHKSKRVKDMPNLISQLNVFLDENGILRVKSKVNRWKDKEKYTLAPILLARESRLTRLVILHMHIKNSHAGVYSVLSELRKTFWIPKYFSVVKKELRKCVNCRRFNRRTVKLNQSPYRDFRLDPPNIPYRSIFLDYLGPYYVKINNVKTKVWLVCITCLWSRAINLKICIDLTVPTFLRAFQLHVWEYGFPKNCFSDMGTQIIAGTNIISDFLGDVQTKQYLQENNINAIQFQQYYKGCNELGSLVEACVKLVKRLFGSIKNYVLDYFAFEFHIFQVIHLVNRRPIAFKESLRETNNEIVPSAITPEILLKGYEFISLNVIPNLQSIPDLDPTWKPDKDHVSQVKDNYYKLRKARESLTDIYNNEFLGQLIYQATNSNSRYKPKAHTKLQVGDIVLLKEPYSKPSNYPMGIVKDLQVNSLDEVTGATVKKGNKELVKRHSSSLIPLLSVKECLNTLDGSLDTHIQPNNDEISDTHSKPTNGKQIPPKRKAALKSRENTLKLIRDNNI